MDNVEKLIAFLEAREEGWRREMLFLYDQGASDSEVMRELDLTLDQWRALEGSPVDSSFKEVVDVGRMRSRAWWEKQGRKNLNSKQFNAVLYKFMMANNFGWSDKSETSMTNIEFKNMDDRELISKIREMSKRLNESRDSTTV